MVKAVGPARTILSTDLGQLHNAPPWEGLRVFVQLMLENGIKPSEIETMLHKNPARVLGLAAQGPEAGDEIRFITGAWKVFARHS